MMKKTVSFKPDQRTDMLINAFKMCNMAILKLIYFIENNSVMSFIVNAARGI